MRVVLVQLVHILLGLHVLLAWLEGGVLRAPLFVRHAWRGGTPPRQAPLPPTRASLAAPGNILLVHLQLARCVSRGTSRQLLGRLRARHAPPGTPLHQPATQAVLHVPLDGGRHQRVQDVPHAWLVVIHQSLWHLPHVWIVRQGNFRTLRAALCAGIVLPIHTRQQLQRQCALIVPLATIRLVQGIQTAMTA